MNNINLTTILLMVFIPFVFVALIIPVIKNVAMHVGAMDIPDKRKVHTKPMARLGGLGIYAGFLLGYMIFGEQTTMMNSILIGSFIVVLTGIIDDIKPIKASYKLLGHIAAASVIVFYGGILLNNVNAEFEQTSYQFSSKMGVGINIGNLLDSTSGGETGWGNPKISKALVTAFKNKGFKTVRIPITWGYQCDSAGNINSSYLARVKEVVDYAYSQDMYVIINTHHEMGWLRTWWANAYGEQNTAKLEKMLARFGTIWTQISKTFSSYGERLVFEELLIMQLALLKLKNNYEKDI